MQQQGKGDLLSQLYAREDGGKHGAPNKSHQNAPNYGLYNLQTINYLFQYLFILHQDDVRLGLDTHPGHLLPAQLPADGRRDAPVKQKYFVVVEKYLLF